MKELNLLERAIVAPFINEEDKETIAVYPGAFKPPHRGHLSVVEKANAVADKTIVVISQADRDGFTAEDSLKIWEIYTKDMPNVEVRIASKPSPVSEAYSLFRHNPEKNYVMALGKNEFSRVENLDRYHNAKPFDAGTLEDLSSTNLRQAIRENDNDAIQNFLPEGVNLEEYLSIFNQTPVNEIGDAGAESYEYGRYKVDGRTISYNFTTDSDTKYTVELDIEEDWSDTSGDHKIMRVEFGIEEDEGKLSHKAVVNKGELFKVMATIVKIIKKTLSQIKGIKTINFTASKNDPEDTRRLKLYLAYVKKQLPGAEVEMDSDVEANIYLPENVNLDKEYIEHLENIRNDFYNRGLKDKAAKVQADIDKLIKKDKIEEEIDGLENAKIQLSNRPYKILDIEYKKTRRGEKFIKITYEEEYVPGKMYWSRPQFVNILYDTDEELEYIKKELKLPVEEINEDHYPENFLQDSITSFAQYMEDSGMQIAPPPRVEFVNDDVENAENLLGKTAYYDPQNQVIVLYTLGRHPKDILRSFAHEMIHHIQNLEGRLGGINTTNTNEDDYLDQIEREAYEHGNMTFRNWTDSILHENINEVEADLGDTLVPFLKDIVDQLKQLNANSEDSEDDIEGLDKSIDYLASALTGKSAFDINIDQTYLGRLASPGDDKVKVKENNFKLSELKDIIRSVNESDENNFENELESFAKQLGSEIEDEIEEKGGLKEAIGIASIIGWMLLSNTVANMLSKFAKKQFAKYDFGKGEAAAKKIYNFTHKNEEAFKAPIKRIVGLFTKNEKYKKQISDVLYAILIFMMAGQAGGDAVGYIKKAGYLKGGIYSLKSLVKGKEVHTLIKGVIEDL